MYTRKNTLSIFSSHPIPLSAICLCRASAAHRRGGTWEHISHQMSPFAANPIKQANRQCCMHSEHLTKAFLYGTTGHSFLERLSVQTSSSGRSGTYSSPYVQATFLPTTISCCMSGVASNRCIYFLSPIMWSVLCCNVSYEGLLFSDPGQAGSSPVGNQSISCSWNSNACRH